MKARGVASALALAVLSACGLPEGEYFGKIPDDIDPTHLRWCNSGEPEYVDPAMVTSTTGSPLARLMFAGLADWGTDFKGTTVPSIAERWDVADDLRTFTFHLRDDVKWSNGRPLTSADFAYHVTRILHPKTTSRNTTPFDPVKNAQRFTKGTVKVLTADAAPFRKGEVVEVVGLDGTTTAEGEKLSAPNTNLRRASKPVQLRDLGKPASEAYSTVAAGEELDIVELGGPKGDWAYVFCSCNDWIYGWVPLAELDIEPNAEVAYTVRELPPEDRPGVSLPPDPDADLRQGTVAGKHLLTLPEAIGIRTPDPYTFVVETTGPTPYLVNDIKGRVFRPTPRESVSRSPKRWTMPSEGLLVTSGPFTMTKWLERDRMEFEKSDTFFLKDEVKLERFTSYNMNDQAASANFYLQGGCDAVTSNNIPYSYIPALSGAKRGKPYRDFKLRPYSGIYYYVFNTEKVTNKHFRRALNYAIDRSAFPMLLHGKENPSSSFTPGRAISALSDEELAVCGVTRDTPGVAVFVEEDLCYVPPPGLDFDLDKAKQELALAREQMGAAFKNSISIKFNTGVEGHKIVAEYIQNQWMENLGLDVQLESQEWKTYLKDTNAGEFEVGRMGWIATPDPEAGFLLVFKCGSPYNRSRWCNEKFDALFKKAESLPDRAERMRIMKEIEALMLEEAPVAPLYIYTQKHLQKPFVKDLVINIDDNPPMWRTWLDPDWRQSAAESSK